MKPLTLLLFTSALLVPGLFAANEAATALAHDAAAALQANDTKTAVDLYEKAIAADPTDATLQTDYANALAVRINQVNFMLKAMIAGKMLGAYQRSVELDPNHVVGWIGLCRYHLNAPPIAGGSLDKAAAYAAEVAKRVPWLGEVELGLVAEKRGDNAAAAEHFRAVLADHPNHAEAKAGLARVEAPAAPSASAAEPASSTEPATNAAGS